VIFKINIEQNLYYFRIKTRVRYGKEIENQLRILMKQEEKRKKVRNQEDRITFEKNSR